MSVREQVDLYNDNTEELATAFTIVTTSLDKDSTKEDAANAWMEQADILGSDLINIAGLVISNVK